MKPKNVVFVSILTIGVLLVVLLATTASATEGGACLLEPTRNPTFPPSLESGGRFDKDFLDWVVGMLLKVVHELFGLVGEVLCAILDGLGFSCRGVK